MNGLLYGLLGGIEAGGNAGADILRENAKAARDKAYKDQEWQREKDYKQELIEDERSYQKGLLTEERQWKSGEKQRDWERERAAEKGKYVPLYMDEEGTLTADQGKAATPQIGVMDSWTHKPEIWTTKDKKGKSRSGSGKGSGSGGSDEGMSDVYVRGPNGESVRVSMGVNDNGQPFYRVMDQMGNITTKNVGVRNVDSMQAGQEYADKVLSGVGIWGTNIGGTDINDLMQQYGAKDEDQLRSILEMEGERNYLITQQLMDEGYRLDRTAPTAGQNKANIDAKTGQPLQPAGSQQADAATQGQAHILEPETIQVLMSGAGPVDYFKNRPYDLFNWDGEVISGEEAYRRVMEARKQKQQGDQTAAIQKALNGMNDYADA